MTKLVDISLNRPVALFMIFIAILLLGIISLSKLPVELMPNIHLGKITVITYVRGGLSSEDVEERVTKKLEDALGDTSYLRNLVTISKEGESTVIMEFEPEANMDYVSLEVREKLAKIKDKLPREAERPIVFQYGYGEFPIIAVTFTSKHFSPEKLRKILEENVKEKFLRIGGVARIEIVGGREEKIIIEVDEKKLASYNLSLTDVLDVLAVSNINISGGKIELTRGGKNYIIRCLGEFPDVEKINQAGIKTTPEGSIIRIKDIGKAKISYLEPREIGRTNSQLSVTLYIFKKSLANTLKVCDEVISRAKKTEKKFSPYIQTLIPFNQGEFIRKAINQLKLSLLVGATAATLILLFFLRSFSAIAILFLSLPFSIFFTFSFMYMFKMSLNVMTLAGLCLGAGMLLDSGIVVMENIFRAPGKGKAMDRETIRTNTKEVALALFASTLTTLIVFLPFIFLNKETQRLYKGIASTICFSLVASLFIALSLVPLFSQLFLKKVKEIKRAIFVKIQRGYKKSLNFVFHLRYILIGLVIIGLIETLTVGSRLEKEFIGVPEIDKFTAFIQMPTGTKMEITDKIVKKVEGFLEEYKKAGEIKTYTTHIEPYSAKIYVQLTPYEKRKKTASQIITELRKKTKNMDPAFIYYEESQEVESKEIILEFLGYDYSILKELAKKGGAYLKGIEGLTDVKLRMREGGPRFNIMLDNKRVGLWRLNTEWIATELHGKMRGLIPTRFHKKETFLTTKKETTPSLPSFLSFERAKELEVIARLKKKYRKKSTDIKNIVLLTPRSGLCQLKQIATFKTDLAPSEIWRKNKKRMVQVSANRERIPLGKAANQIKKALRDLHLPEGYTWRFGENYYKMVRNQKELKLAFLGALVLVYLVLASLFESLTQPFIILTSVPLSAIGCVNLLYFKKEPLGIGVLIGGIMLVGIVVNNAIILIDYINRLRKSGFSVKSAVIEAASLRLRPIMMTTLTTILPLFPLLIFKTDASPLWAPLALTVISGLLVSTILTLYILPCIYLTFYRK